MLKLGSMRSDQSQSSTLGHKTNSSPGLKYFLSENIHDQENGSRGTHFAKFLISNFLKGLTYSGSGLWYTCKSAFYFNSSCIRNDCFVNSACIQSSNINKNVLFICSMYLLFVTTMHPTVQCSGELVFQTAQTLIEK